MADTDKLSPRDQVELVRIARDAIRARLERGTLSTLEVEGERLRRPAGAFVSLHQDGHLRGCIGALSADDPLHVTIAEVAVQAATSDSRFPPMSLKELSRTEIEVSVLGPLEPIAIEDIVVGEHGLFVHKGRYRGVLLPQVATQYGWTREQFVSETCRKAGLPADAWKDEDTFVLAFTAEVFSEMELLDAGHLL